MVQWLKQSRVCGLNPEGIANFSEEFCKFISDANSKAHWLSVPWDHGPNSSGGEKKFLFRF